MSEEKKDKKCCTTDAEGKKKCCCKFKKFFPHNWFKLKCLSHIFTFLFYVNLIGFIYMVVQTCRFYKYAKLGMVSPEGLTTMIFIAASVLVTGFVFLAFAKFAKALRKIKCILKGDCGCEVKK